MLLPISFPIDDALLTFHSCLHSTHCTIRICREKYTINLSDISNCGRGEPVNIAKKNFHFAYHDFYLNIALIFSDLWQILWLWQLQRCFFLLAYKQANMPYIMSSGRGMGINCLVSTQDQSKKSVRWVRNKWDIKEV